MLSSDKKIEMSILEKINIVNLISEFINGKYKKIQIRRYDYLPKSMKNGYVHRGKFEFVSMMLFLTVHPPKKKTPPPPPPPPHPGKVPKLEI